MFVSSDVEEIVSDAMEMMDLNKSFCLWDKLEPQYRFAGGWNAYKGLLTGQDGYLNVNPLMFPSERELVCEKMWRRVYRCLYVKQPII